jgi:hypothetical protein
MMPRWHVLYGFIFSYILVYFFNFSLFSGFVIFLTSIFMDLDHVLLYYLDTKNLNPSKFMNYSRKRKECWRNISENESNLYKKPHFILHGMEFLLLLLIFSFLHVFFLWILIGILIHLFFDLFVLIYEKEHISIKTSQIWLWQRNKNKKKFIIK